MANKNSKLLSGYRWFEKCLWITDSTLGKVSRRLWVGGVVFAKDWLGQSNVNIALRFIVRSQMDLSEICLYVSMCGSAFYF